MDGPWWRDYAPLTPILLLIISLGKYGSDALPPGKKYDHQSFVVVFFTEELYLDGGTINKSYLQIKKVP